MSSLDEQQMNSMKWPWLQPQQPQPQGDAAPEPEPEPTEPEPTLEELEAQLGAVGPDGFWRPYNTEKMPTPEQ